MIRNNILKELYQTQYYTGAHPLIRAHNRSGKRPTEFGNKIWATTQVVMAFLETPVLDLKGKRVLEVGCGWGLLGIYLANKHGCKVTCSDFDTHVLPIVDLHAELNEIEVTSLQSSFGDFTVESLKEFDVIIGCEICYNEEVSKQIGQLIERAKEAGVQKVIIADPGRPDFDYLVETSQNNFNTEMLTLPGTVNGKTTNLLVARH